MQLIPSLVVDRLPIRLWTIGNLRTVAGHDLHFCMDPAGRRNIEVDGREIAHGRRISVLTETFPDSPESRPRPRSRDFRGSSVTKMSWAALLGTERLLMARSIAEPSVQALLDHLWAYSTIDSESFLAWYDARPELVEVGLGDPMPDRLVRSFDDAGIRPDHAHDLIEGLTEIIYTNLFGAVTWERVEREFDRVVHILAEYEHAVPSPDLLPESDRLGASGWGDPIGTAKLDEIRSLDWRPPA